MCAGPAANPAAARPGPIASTQINPAAAGPASHHSRHRLTRPVTGERHRQHEGELGQQQVAEQEQDRAAGHHPPAAHDRARRNRLAGTPRHRSHPWHSLAPPQQLSTLGCQECTLRVDTY